MSEQPFSFNLLDEPWLPCLDGATRQPVHVGIREVLLRAHELQEIADASPIVTAALQRLLLAVLHRILGPPTGEAWIELWRRRRWDSDQIAAYLKNWRHRFDLFHPERPFYQTTLVAEEYATTPATKLLLELASGNNATLFDHTLDSQFRPLDPAAAARAIVTFQAFAPGGLVGFEKGQAQHRSANAAPLARGAMALVRGSNLFETLQLNLVRYDPQLKEPPRTTTGDRPAWESDAEVLAQDRAPLGHLDYLTWQSRRLRLIPEHDANDRTVVRKVIVMKGAQLPDGYSATEYEQMVAFKKRKNAAPKQEPFVPVGFTEARAFWRDSQALLDTFDTSDDLPPRTLRWLSDVTTEFPDDFEQNGEHPQVLDLLGLTGDRAKLLFWRHERLPLPSAYLRDRYLIEALGSALRMAEEGETALRRAVNQLVTLALVPNTGQGGRQADRKMVDGLAAHLDAGRAYWSTLEALFKLLLRELPDDREPDGQPGYGPTKLPAWHDRVRRTAREALLTALSGFDNGPRTAKAVAVSQRTLDYWLAALITGPRAQMGVTPNASS